MPLTSGFQQCFAQFRFLQWLLVTTGAVWNTWHSTSTASSFLHFDLILLNELVKGVGKKKKKNKPCFRQGGGWKALHKCVSLSILSSDKGCLSPLLGGAGWFSRVISARETQFQEILASTISKPCLMLQICFRKASVIWGATMSSLFLLLGRGHTLILVSMK